MRGVGRVSERGRKERTEVGRVSERGRKERREVGKVSERGQEGRLVCSGMPMYLTLSFCFSVAMAPRVVLSLLRSSVSTASRQLPLIYPTHTHRALREVVRERKSSSKNEV